MREIKFRGYRSDGVGWIYGSLVINKNFLTSDESGTIKYKTAYLVYDSDRAYEVDEGSVGQFSGVCDVSGSNIYEGDIVRWIDSDGNERIDTVKWMNGGLCLCNNSYTVGSYRVSIIGNIVRGFFYTLS